MGNDCRSKSSSSRVIFPEHWVNNPRHPIVHAKSHQYSVGRCHHSDSNFFEKRRIFSYDGNNMKKGAGFPIPHGIREVKSLPSNIYDKKNKLESSLGVRKKRGCLPLSVSFDPKISIFLFDLDIERLSISNNQIRVEDCWSRY